MTRILRAVVPPAALAVLAALAGCSDANAPEQPTSAADLTGTVWEQASYDAAEDVIVHVRRDELPEEQLAYAFDAGGALRYRNFGFCATPPLTWFVSTGTWALDGDNLEIACNGVEQRFAIVRVTETELRLRPLRE